MEKETKHKQYSQDKFRWVINMSKKQLIQI